MIRYFIIGILSLIGVLVLGWTAAYYFDPHQQALRKWENRPFERYRLIVTTEGGCNFDIEVDGTDVVRTHSNSCPNYPVRTIDDIFKYKDNEGICGGNGCGCDGYFVVDITYNEAYGYPEEWGGDFEIDELRWFLEEGWRTLSFRPYICTLLYTEIFGGRVVAFMPLP